MSTRGLLTLALLAGVALPAPAAAQLPPLPPVPGTQPPPRDPQPPPPPPRPGSAAAGASYFGNPSGNGAAHDLSVFGPLQRIWGKRFTQLANTPLITGGRAIVNVSNQDPGGGYGSEVIAYDVRTGRQVWRRSTPGVYFSAHLAASGDRVVAVNSDGVARAFTVADGTPLWQVQTEGAHGGVPVAADGVMYVASGGGSSVVAAYSMTNGARLWRTTTRVETFGSMPVLDSERVYLADGNGEAVAIDRRTGRIVWQRTGSGGLVQQTAVHNGGLFAATRRWNATTGPEGARLRRPVRAFAGSLGVYWDGDEASGVPLDGSSVRWTWSVPRVEDEIAYADAAKTSPLIVGPTAYLADGYDRLWGLEAGSGAVLSRSRLPRNAGGSGVGGGQHGMAAANGVLVVNYGATLTAYAPVLRPPARGADLAATRFDLVFGKRVGIVGGVAPGLRRPGLRLTLQADAFPFRGYSRAARGRALADGTASFTARPTRNTRFRVRGGGSQPSRGLTIFVLPKISSSARATSRTRGVVRATLRGDRRFRPAGGRFVVYLGRVRAKRFVRLGSSRLRMAGRGRAQARVAIRLPRRVGRRDTILYCVPKLSRLGYGRRDFIERRCGRRTIKFPR